MSLSIECLYEGRRRKRLATGSIGTLKSITDSGQVEASRGSEPERAQEPGGQSKGEHDAQERKEVDWLSQMQYMTNMGEDKQLEMDIQLPGWSNHGSSNESAVGDFDEWMDTDAFRLSPLPNPQFTGSLQDGRKESLFQDLDGLPGM